MYPIATYAADIGTLKANERKRIDAYEMVLYKRM